MVTLTEVQRQADQLSAEDRESLLSYLLHGLHEAPLGADDAEVFRREREMDSGICATLSYEEFLEQAGRSIS